MSTPQLTVPGNIVVQLQSSPSTNSLLTQAQAPTQTQTQTPTPTMFRNIVVQVPPAPSTKIWLIPIIGTFLLFIGAMLWIGFTITAVPQAQAPAPYIKNDDIM